MYVFFFDFSRERLFCKEAGWGKKRKKIKEGCQDESKSRVFSHLVKGEESVGFF